MQNYKTNIENGTLVGFSNGINICANAVKGTIGKGSNVIIQHENYPYYICTKDAFSVIQSIKLENPIENQAVLMLKDATDSQNKRSRDGRTAMTLIADSILQESMRRRFSWKFPFFKRENPAKINKEITDLLPKIEDLILEQKKSISVDEIYKVAQTASDSERIGKLLGEIYKKVGKDGIIHVEGSGTWNDSVQYIEGTRFNDVGFISPYMVHDELAKKEGKKEYKAIYEKPLILVTKRKVEKVSDISPLIDLAIKENKALVIFTDDMESTIASNIVATHRAGIAKLLIVRAPTLWKNLVYEDFAKVVGATVIEESSGKNFKNLAFEDLGTCDKIIVDKEETVVIGGQDISEHINELKTRGDNDSLIRLMWLTTKTAILKLGANNEGELSFLRLKTEDAVHSSRLALIDGVVEGAGKCLWSISKQMPDSIGGKILKKALCRPLEQITENANGDEIPNDLLDSADVVRNSVRNAIALASIPLTSTVFISIPPKSQEQLMHETLQAQGRRF